MRVVYEPGGMLAIVSEEGVAVLRAVPVTFSAMQRDALIEAVWDGLDESVEAVIEALRETFGGEGETLPPFAVAIADGEAVRVGVRGAIAVTVEGTVDGAPVEHDVVAPAGEPWAVSRFEDALSVGVRGRPGASAPDAGALPIGSGAVLASAVRAVFFDVADPDSVPVDAVSADAVPVDAAPVDSVPVLVPPPAGSVDDVSELPVETLPPSAIDDELADAGPEGVEPEGEPIVPETGGEPAAAEPAHEPLDLLEADTILVRGGSGEDSGEPDGDHDGATISVAQLRALQEQRATGAPGGPPLPPIPPVPPPPVLAAPQGVVEGDHDGRTLLSGELPGVRGLLGAGPLPPASPPPVPAPPTGPAFAPAPRHGRIRISTGEVVVLDRPVVIGRRPRSTRTSVEEIPHLVAVPSPEQDISRNHVEIVSDGEAIVVTDLHTTNGTVLLRAGAEPVRMRPGEQTLVVAGDLIDLGDGITVEFEGLS